MTVSAYKSIRIFGIAGTPLVSALIIIFSFLPASTLVSTGWFGLLRDKGAHALAYAALGFFLYCAIVTKESRPTWSHAFSANGWRMLLVLGVSVLLGSAIEIIQPYYGRSFEVLDIVADGVGSILGMVFGFLLVTIAMRSDSRRGIL